MNWPWNLIMDILKYFWPLPINVITFFLSLYVFTRCPACSLDGHFVFSVMASDTDPPIDPRNLIVKDHPHCSPVKATQDEAIFKFGVMDCGTKSKVSKKQTHLWHFIEVEFECMWETHFSWSPLNLLAFRLMEMRWSTRWIWWSGTKAQRDSRNSCELFSDATQFSAKCNSLLTKGCVRACLDSRSNVNTVPQT